MSNRIEAVDVQTTHKICSGQVVLTLATAVKELVENGLDAGGRVLTVRLWAHGSERVEVADDGHGVSEDNYRGLSECRRRRRLFNE